MSGSIWAKGLTVSAKAVRAFAGALMSSPSGRPLGGFSGVSPGTDGSILSVTSSQWAVQPFAGYFDVSAAGDAGTPFAFLTAETGALNAADSSNARADLLWVRHDDPDLTNDNTKPPQATLGYTAGSASSSPQLPATPGRAIPLARIDVPKLNNGAPTISLIAPFTVAAGGVMPVTRPAAYPTGPYVGMAIRDLTDGRVREWTGATNGWKLVNSNCFLVVRNKVTIGIGNNASASTTIPFGRTFATVPDVMYVLEQDTNAVLSVTARTTSSCKVRAARSDGQNAANSGDVSFALIVIDHELTAP